MALVKLSAMVDDARGSVAGITFTRNRYGAVARQKVSGVQPRTSRQLSQRSIFSQATKAWRNLSASAQAAWRAYAASHPFVDRLGDARTLAGNAIYTKLNADRFTLGLSRLDTPPADPTVTPAPAVSVAADSTAGTVTVTTTAQTVSTGFYEVYCTPGLSPGAAFGGSKLRLAASAATVAAATTVVANPATFNPKLGFIAAQVLVVTVVRFDPAGVRIDVTKFTVTAA